jgi:hypothetical protein
MNQTPGPCPAHGGDPAPPVPWLDFRDCDGVAALLVGGQVIAHAGEHEAGQLSTWLADWAVRQHEEEARWVA